MSGLISLWFGFKERVSQKTYALTGLGLMVLKYLGDSAILGLAG